MSRLKAFFKQYHWHWALLRLIVILPIVCLLWIGDAGDRLYDWADDALPDASKEK